MRQFDCPQCSAPIPFETPGAVFAVCPSCRSMVVRRDIELEAIGTMAELPPDSSPLQLGAVGTLGNTRFRLLGRLRLAWQDGVWSEWYADFGQDRNGWVAESQGFFYISESAPVPAEVVRVAKHPTLDKKIPIAGTIYKVTDIKDVRVLGAEGELPFSAVPGETWRGIDFTAKGRQFAGAEWADGATRLYLGTTALPEEIRWEGLRKVPGWNGEPVPIEKKLTQALNCPECGGVIEQRLAGVTTTLSCSHCGTVLDVKGEKAITAQKIKAAERLMRPIIPLGKRGVLRGVEWQVLGCLKRDDGWGGWTEILLHNPWHGFVWLTESNGHWNFVKRLLDEPEGSNQQPVLRGVSYKIFSNGEVKVSQLAGEFYWKIRVGEKATAIDYIAPPRLLSFESYPELKETSWSEGEYLPPEEVSAAFGIQHQRPSGPVFLNQPNPWELRWPSLKRLAVLAILIALALEIVFSLFSLKRTVLEQSFEFKRPTEVGAAVTPIISPSFEINGSQKPATIEIQAGVDNAWIGMDVELVNEQTGAVYPAEVVVEYYHGYDDGNWEEGSNKESTDLPAVPPGRYHLSLTPEADPSITSLPFQVKIRHGGVFWSNFFLCLLAIGVWPIWAFFRYHGFESKRWSESDFSP